MKKLLFLIVLLLLSSMAVFAQEEITYPIEGFETGFLAGIWPSNNKIAATVSKETKNVHSGKTAQKCTWDFTKQEEDGGFISYFMHREVIGTVKSVSFWVYVDEKSKGVYLNVWVCDTTGETYIAGTKADKVGWQKLTANIPDGPAWDSGDKNRKQDLPVRIFGIFVEGGPSPKKGEMIVDDISVTVQASPRESVLTSMELTNYPFNIAWSTYPELEVKSNNMSSSSVKNFKYTFKVYDLYYKKYVDEKELTIKEIPSKTEIKNKITFKIPYGHYRLDWELTDDTGKIMSKSMNITAFMEACGKNLLPSLETYLQKTGVWGGVFWQCTPEQARNTGARWIRNFGADWNNTEIAKDKFDTTKLKQSILDFQKYGIDSLQLTCLYNQPEWRKGTNLDFATGYGNLHKAMAKDVKGLLKWYEFGNEDNGPTKFIYTEVTRNGAAGVRSEDSTALVANSGTAFVDISWFRLQMSRNLFDRLDAFVTHPYTVTTSPEKWGVYEQGQNMINLIDEVGGFKQLWSTEFGYSYQGDGYVVPDEDRADYIVRHFLIENAAGYSKAGLYAWDGHFGIYSSQNPLIPAVAVQAMAKKLEGYKYAGTLVREDNKWVMVWEKLGSPIVIGWTVNGTGSENIENTNGKLFDIFGNPLEFSGNLMPLATGPRYLFGATSDVLKEAWNYSIIAEIKRANNNLDNKINENADIDTIWNKLSQISDNYIKNPGTKISAAQEHLVKALMIKARAGEKLPTAINNDGLAKNFVDNAKKQLEEARKADVDYPRLRWALTEFENLEYERLFAIESKNSNFTARIRNAQKVIAVFANKYLMDSSEAKQNLVWAYLYNYAKDGKSLDEKLKFVPGTKTKVNVRVSNYANNSYTAKVSLNIPKGWSVTPKVQEVKLTPNKNAETTFEILATSNDDNRYVITTEVAIPKKPIGRATFNDIEVLAPVLVEQIPIQGLLPETPISFKLTNVDNKPHSGSVNILLNKDKSVIGKADFSNIEPDKNTTVSIKLNDNFKNHANWEMVAELKIDNGKTARIDFNTDFLCATKTTNPMVIDGELDDWQDALPLHMDKADYTNNSFGGAWSKEDLSGTAYYKWDNDYFYMAYVINDQTFNQGLLDQSTWMQDSVQFAFAEADHPKKFGEYIFAFTSKGEQAYMDMGADSNLGLSKTIKFKTKLSQGKAVYEIAIPWKNYEKDFGTPALGKEYLIDILLNDDDAVVPRRYMERFGIGIVHDKLTDTFGKLKLIGPSNGTVTNDDGVVFRENFNTYGNNTQPDTWNVINKGPIGIIVAGQGIDGSNALYFESPETKGDYYVIYNKTIDGLIPGAEYEVSAKTKGTIANDASVLGMCSDLWGNEGFVYAPCKSSDDWVDTKVRFGAPASGSFNIILRNSATMKMLIDDVMIKKIEPKK